MINQIVLKNVPCQKTIFTFHYKINDIASITLIILIAAERVRKVTYAYILPINSQKELKKNYFARLKYSWTPSYNHLQWPFIIIYDISCIQLTLNEHQMDHENKGKKNKEFKRGRQLSYKRMGKEIVKIPLQYTAPNRA